MILLLRNLLAFVLVWSSASAAFATDRVSAALQVFEEFCLPYAFGQGALPKVGAPEFKELRRRINPNVDEKFGGWVHIESNMMLTIEERWSGVRSCMITDKYAVLPNLHRYRFQKLAAVWVSQHLPQLIEVEAKPLEGFEVLRGWHVENEADPRPMRVVLYTMGERFSNATTLEFLVKECRNDCGE